MIENSDKTLSVLIEFLDKQPGSRPKAIADGLGISRQYVQRLLAKNRDRFSVSGSGPNRFYRNKVNYASTDLETADNTIVNADDAKLIEDNFYSLTPLGEELIGVSGFIKWCRARNLDIDTMQKEYVSILKKYYGNEFMPPIDFTDKLKTTFKDSALKKVWSVDFYNFEVFEKTKLGTQVMIAKQTGDSQTIAYLIEKLNPILTSIVDRYNIKAVAFVSPTIQRQSQLMRILDNNVALALPRIKVHKVGARILIAQKTLRSLGDRILNASQTFVVESSKKYKNILIIDDALGSGATLNALAKQITQREIATNCYGLVLVASPSGYEVINEV